MSAEGDMYENASRLESSLLALNMTDAAKVVHDMREMLADQQSREAFYWHKVWETEFDRLRRESAQRETA